MPQGMLTSYKTLVREEVNMTTDTITAKCEKCGLKVNDSATEDRPCPNCRATLRYLGPIDAPAAAEEPPAEELSEVEAAELAELDAAQAEWDALDEDAQLEILEYLDAIAS